MRQRTNPDGRARRSIPVGQLFKGEERSLILKGLSLHTKLLVKSTFSCCVQQLQVSPFHFWVDPSFKFSAEPTPFASWEQVCVALLGCSQIRTDMENLPTFVHHTQELSWSWLALCSWQLQPSARVSGSSAFHPSSALDCPTERVTDHLFPVWNTFLQQFGTRFTSSRQTSQAQEAAPQSQVASSLAPLAIAPTMAPPAQIPPWATSLTPTLLLESQAM